MYYQLAQHQRVENGRPQFSQAVAMAGGNSVFVTGLCEFANSGVEVTISLEVGNELEQWYEGGADMTLSGGGKNDKFQVDGIAAQYVRLKYEVTTGTGTAIVSAGMNTAST